MRKQRDAPLREFVYLDEVSVFSLISSRLGPVATEFIATESSSLTEKLAGATGVSAGVLKSEINSRSESTQTQGTQVLRKATVQATFKELYRHEEGGFLLRPLTDAPPDLRDARDVNAALERCREDRWATPASDLARGKLTEIEVKLDAEDIFRVGAVMGSFLELFQEAPELLGPEVREQLQQGLSVNAVINKLLAGLIPVRGQATDYVTVRTSDQEWVVHRMVLRQLGDDVMAQVRALDVVAVAEASLFWKDIRRVLFSASRYSVLCRINRDGLHDGWTPVKLADVVRGLAPAAAEQISTVGPALLTAATHGTATGLQIDDPHTRMRTALLTYGRLLAAHYGQDTQWDPTLITEDILPGDRTHTWATVEERRPPFEALTHQLRDAFGIDPNRELMTTLRYEALLHAGLVPLMGPGFGQYHATPAPQQDEPHSRILDTELIAIYW
jgi:hypothetical protein